MDLQREDIQPHRTLQAGEDQARDGMGAEQHPGLEAQFDNIAPFPQLELDLPVAQQDLRTCAVDHVERDRQADRARSIPALGLRAGKIGRITAFALRDQADDHCLFLRLVFSCQQRTHTQLAADIRCAEPGQGHDRQLRPGREHRRPPQCCCRVAHLGGFLEERPRRIGRHELLAQRALARRQDGHIGNIGGRVAVHEIEDTMPARVTARGDAGP